MVSPTYTAPRLAALLGGPGIDGSLNGLDDPKSGWQLAESLGLAQPARASIELLSSPDVLFAQLDGTSLKELVLRVEWARLEPAEGELNKEALAAWVAIARHAKAQGIGVEVVLNGGVLPAWLGTEGWLLPATPERFASLARGVAEAMGEHVDGVITLEAPARFVVAGWVLGLAPPFRRAAMRDALAALDGMLSGHLLSLQALRAEGPPLELSLLPSGGHLGELEAALLGAPGDVLPQALSSVVAGQSPGRARALAREVTAPWGTRAWAVVGRGAGPREGAASSMLEVLSGTARPSAEEVEHALRRAQGRSSSGDVSLLWRRSAAVIEEGGKRTVSSGSSLLEAAPPVVEGIVRCAEHGPLPDRLVLGELVDRWEMGSYDVREGLLGVEHRRAGVEHARLLSSDSAGNDALGALRELDGLLAKG